MPLTHEESKRTLVDGVVRALTTRVPVKEREAAERWVRQVYAGAPPRDLAGEPPENLVGAALAVWSFAAERRAGAAKVRVYQPEAKAHGWSSPHTIVETVTDDMPHLVDSVSGYLNESEREVQLIVHPIVSVSRDAAGRRTELHLDGKAGAGALRESVMQIRIAAQPHGTFPGLQAGVEHVLALARRAHEDRAAMAARLTEVADGVAKGAPGAGAPVADVEAAVGFLRWLAGDSFVLLGYRQTGSSGATTPGTALGLLRDEAFTLFGDAAPAESPAAARTGGAAAAATAAGPQSAPKGGARRDLVRVTKSSRRSPVHRPALLDVITVPVVGPKGQIAGEHVFVGLFALSVYARSPRQIPLLAGKIDAVLERSGFPLETHRGKQLQHILETFPRDELFQAGVDELYELTIGILHLQERSRVALFARRDALRRHVSCLVYAPRDRYDSTLRKRFAAVLEEAYGGTLATFSTNSGDALARVHFMITTPPGAPATVDEAKVEERLAEAARSWSDRLQEALLALSRADREAALARGKRFVQAFPASYQEATEPATAAEDVLLVEEALARGDLAMNLYRRPGSPKSALRFKVYFTGRTAPLSEVLPMLENMGLKVLEENPYDVKPASPAPSVRIRDFDMVTADGREIDVDLVRDAFHEAFAEVWRGSMENDGFNRLILGAGISARDVTILRAQCRYLRQAGIPFSQPYMENTLACNPEVARLLVTLFRRRLDPARPERREEESATILEDLRRRLDAVTNLDEDRILRRFLNLVECTLRTNVWQKGADGLPAPYLAFKLDSRRVDELPAPRPLVEIWVYSTRFEAVHLRGGRVARGGIRWSDRREDFRTEVLGLMKAQMVKNAVIVPVGSKGGFVVKQPPEKREDLQAEVVRCYQGLIQGLLDLTDNLQGTRVVPPKDVVRRDGDDPYLVVAADKGTATFSDYANGLSVRHTFWLDDAFASGGSAGYDHKKMGITAKGGWESVKRHFREAGKDIQTQDTTVVGVGDMSGDVFGNALLLSRHLRLLGAFDHRHIFVDPTPDAASSFLERERMFALPRSSWADYDAKRISKGGGVFDRKAKSIPVSPEMRTTFGLLKDTVTPGELMRAILTADAELMWFGGIGTFVKATRETHADVGDRANDSVRIDAPELRVKVVGEGANLALTQRARIEAGLRGTRLNTDAIDNSGGVDCSDHEVNIKIALRDVEQRGLLTRPQRDELLRSMTDDVAALVLRDNYLQTQAITVTHALSGHLVDRIGRFMRSLEAAGKLDRKLEALPDDETLLERRGVGFARPELSILLAYAKIDLYDQLLASDLPDDPAMEEELRRYFPVALQKHHADAIAQHRLRREIIATVLTNSLVNRVGVTFVHEVRDKTGMAAADVARSFAVGRSVFAMRDLWRSVEALDGRAGAQDQARMLAEGGRLLERAAVWLLREEPQPLDIGKTVATYRPGVEEMSRLLRDVVGGQARRTLEASAAEWTGRGVPAEVAWSAASLGVMGAALDVVRLARQTNLSVAQVARTYFAVGERFGFDWLRKTAGALPAESAWDKLALTAVIDDLYAHQAGLTKSVLQASSPTAPVTAALEAWVDRRRSPVARAEQLLQELQAGAVPNLSMLAVANRALKSLAS